MTDFKKVFICILLLMFTASLELKSQDSYSIHTLFDLSLSELMNIKIISASKQTETIEEAPATVMVVTAEQIKERGYQSIEEVLRDIPGFDLVHVQGTFPTIWAQRGSYGDENKRTLVMIDGIIENNILEGNVLGGPQYSLHNIDQIEIIWGPASALYGANAFSGIINIITKKGEDINGFEYQKGYGSNNTQYDKILAGIKYNNIDFTFSGSIYNTDGAVLKERHPNYSNSYVENAYSIVTRLNYKNFTIGFNRFDRPMGIGQFSNRPGFYKLPGYGYNNNEGNSWGGAQSDINGEKSGLWHSISQSIFLNYKLNFEKSNLQTKVYYRISEIAEDSYEYDYIGNNRFRRDVYAHWSNSIGAELQYDYNFNQNHGLISGIQIEQNNVERGYRNSAFLSEDSSYIYMILADNRDRKYDIYNNIGMYLQYKMRTNFLNSTNIIFGIRYDYNNLYGGTTNPRIGIVTKPLKKITIKALVGTAYRAPNSFELFTETTIRVQNPDLKPEKAFSAELGIIGHINENMVIEGNIFLNSFSEIIVSNVAVGDITGDGINNFQNLNLGTAEIYGVELKYNAKFTNSLMGFLNLTWQEATQFENDFSYDVPNIANFKGNIGLRYNLLDFLIINITENYVGDRSTSLQNLYDKVDGYFMTNISLISKKMFNHITLSATINNLFDEKYYDPGIRAANGSYYGTRHIQPGRIAQLRLIVNL